MLSVLRCFKVCCDSHMESSLAISVRSGSTETYLQVKVTHSRYLNTGEYVQLLLFNKRSMYVLLCNQFSNWLKKEKQF